MHAVIFNSYRLCLNISHIFYIKQDRYLQKGINYLIRLATVVSFKSRRASISIQSAIFNSYSPVSRHRPYILDRIGPIT